MVGVRRFWVYFMAASAIVQVDEMILRAEVQVGQN
jgi:hypothetical protein